MSNDVVEIVPSVEVDYEQNPVTVDPEVAEDENAESNSSQESVDPLRSQEYIDNLNKEIIALANISGKQRYALDVVRNSSAIIDSIHAAASAIAAINARLDKIDPPKEGNDAQA